MSDIWKTLGIEQTTDKRIIRKAYSELIKKHHPEDEPENFKVIRKAYEQALLLTRLQNDAISYEAITDYDYNHNEKDNTSVFETMDQQSVSIISKDSNEQPIAQQLQQKDDEVILATLSLFKNGKANTLEAWQSLFFTYDRYKPVIIKTLFENDLNSIQDERILYYFKKMIQSLPKNQACNYKSYIQQLKQLRNNNKNVDYSIIFVLYWLPATIMNCIACVSSGIYILHFISLLLVNLNNLTIDNIMFFIIAYIYMIQAYLIVTRNLDQSKVFYTRSDALIFFLFYAFIAATYVYQLTSMMLGWEIIKDLNMDILIILFLLIHSFMITKTCNEYYDYTSHAAFFRIFFNSVLYVIMVLSIIGLVFVRDHTDYFSIILYTFMLLYINSKANIYVELKSKRKCYLRVQKLVNITSFISTFYGCIYIFNYMKIPYSNALQGLITQSWDIAFYSFIITWLFIRVLYHVRKMNYEALFQLTEYEEFIPFYREFLLMKCNQGKTMKRLNHFEVAIYYILMFDLEMNKGGFKQYVYSVNANYFDELLRGVEMIQDYALSKLLISFQQLFSKQQIKKNRKERISALEQCLDDIQFENQLISLSQQYDSIEDASIHHCYTYITANKTMFPNIK